jgi:hypothetical protein
MDLSQLPPLKPNPGGEIPADQVVGRDPLIDRLWRVLEDRSVLLGAERRMGKTCILKRMCAEPRPGWTPVFSELEKVHTLVEFVEYVANDLHRFLSRGQKARGRLRDLWKGAGGVEVGGFLKLPHSELRHWEGLLLETLEDAALEQGENRLLLMWDEFPLMVESIRQRDGDRPAMELLDVLRAIRETNPRIRMVLCGSIGIHNVLTALRGAGYGSAPFNNMESVEVLPLEPDDAVMLAARLLKGAGVVCGDLPGAAEGIAEAVSRRPYFIHRLADRLGEAGWAGDPEGIDRTVEELLLSPDDPLDLRHNRLRIEHYYAPERQPLSRNVLDVLAVAERPVGTREILDRLPAPKPDLEELREQLLVLAQDHYLERSASGYQFRFPIVRRWWRLDREL